MKKSKIFIIVSLCFIIALIVSGYLIYTSLFPMAEQIESPHPDTILSFSVKDNSNNELSVDNVYSFYDCLLNSKPTRIMSVNDYPDARPYYEVYITTDDNKVYRYYLYHSNGKDYIEIPYVGVYEIQNCGIDNLFV